MITIAHRELQTVKLMKKLTITQLQSTKSMKMLAQKGESDCLSLKINIFIVCYLKRKKQISLFLIFIQFFDCYYAFSVPNGKYMDDIKYSNMHTVASLDEPKYTNCHIDDHSIKTLPPPQTQSATSQQYATTTTTNLTTVGGCHTDDVNDNSMTVIKSEDANVTHSYVLPPFLH